MANFSCLGLLLALLARGQETPPITTDRPDFTESSTVVPLRSVQVETGLTMVADDGAETWTAPEALVRLSLSERLEARIGLPSHNWGRSDSGWGDLSLGAKLQLGPLPDGTGVALIPAVVLPTGGRAFRGEAATPELKAVWSREVSSAGSFSGMVYAAFEEAGTAWQHTVAYGLSVGPREGVFLEHVLDLSADSRPAHTLHAGWTFRPEPHRQFDVHAGVGLTRNAPTLFVAAGYSIRL